MVKVFLVDDHPVFRSGLRAELGAFASLEIAGEAGCVGEAVEGIVRTAPDVVLLDVHMPDVDLADQLTPRELEVLRLLARGYTYKEIASDLFISVKTVETHASNILRKTQQSNRYALSRWARERDLD